MGAGPSLTAGSAPTPCVCPKQLLEGGGAHILSHPLCRRFQATPPSCPLTTTTHLSALLPRPAACARWPPPPTPTHPPTHPRPTPSPGAGRPRQAPPAGLVYFDLNTVVKDWTTGRSAPLRDSFGLNYGQVRFGRALNAVLGGGGGNSGASSSAHILTLKTQSDA